MTKELTEKLHKRTMIISVFAVLIAASAYVAYDFWLVEQKTQALLRAPGVIAVSDEQNPEKASEGVETTPVQAEDFSSYTVPGDEPRLLTIDSLNLTARIKPMGLNSDKSIQAPKNIYDAGWYTDSAKPGKSGAMFIDGHASGTTRQGLFGYLDTLKPGDTVGVERGDGQKLQYTVVHVAVIPLTDIDMTAILAPYSGVSNGLNLMTCTGRWVDGADTLDHRVVVYTRQV